MLLKPEEIYTKFNEENIQVIIPKKLLFTVNAAALCPAVDVVNCPYIDGIGVHM